MTATPLPPLPPHAQLAVQLLPLLLQVRKHPALRSQPQRLTLQSPDMAATSHVMCWTPELPRAGQMYAQGSRI
jgi:hypothetical protein